MVEASLPETSKDQYFPAPTQLIQPPVPVDLDFLPRGDEEEHFECIMWAAAIQAGVNKFRYFSFLPSPEPVSAWRDELFRSFLGKTAAAWRGNNIMSKVFRRGKFSTNSPTTAGNTFGIALAGNFLEDAALLIFWEMFCQQLLRTLLSSHVSLTWGFWKFSKHGPHNQGWRLENGDGNWSCVLKTWP